MTFAAAFGIGSRLGNDGKQMIIYLLVFIGAMEALGGVGTSTSTGTVTGTGLNAWCRYRYRQLQI